MYAIVETGGKQYKVEVGSTLFVEKLEANEGDKVTLDKVLYVNGTAGAPYVKGATVTAKVEKQGRGKKIVIFKYKPKKKERTKKGHRQSYTKLTVEAINA